MAREENPDFLDIMRANFSEVEIARNEGLARFHESIHEEEATEREQAERIYRASQDPCIVKFLLSDNGDIEQLVARLQSNHDGLTEKEALDIVDAISYQARETVDYGDEA